MYNANQEEQKILDYWDEHGVFEKSVAARSEKNPYHFYDGPPFATGLPHYGHIVASLMKDAVPRYWTMRGKRVERRWGWDCHGLPVENIIEKELNLNSKRDIENYGVGKFNEACRATVLKYAGEWKKTVRRMGRWVDMENDYKTMDLSYMESVWWVFRNLWDMGLVYKGHKAMHICPRCVTPLSNFEVTQGYKDVKDISVTAKFKVKNAKEKLGIDGDVYILAWTTTPWTLPGNVLLAVGEDVEYVVCTAEELNIFFVVAKERAEAIMKDKKYKVERTIKGSDLLGLEYEPLFPYFADTKGAFRVVEGNFVTTADGTGVVHIAPAFGEDDYKVGEREGLPLVQHVSMEGKFIPAVADFAGLEVKPKDDPAKTDVEILKWLSAHDKLFSKESFTHSYPHCWRCDTPLLNYATDCWFVRVTELKDLLLKNNQAIHWVPEHFRDGRFGEWLSGARDWAVSRSRYWGNPLPVWESADGDRLCVGSVAELEKLSGEKITDLHKHIIDKIEIKKDGKIYRRVPEVLDCWFESGSMPYGQMHYPFENKKKFESSFPAEFIAEGQDQTRGWFYTLHVLSTALTRGKKPVIPVKQSEPAFKNVIVNGIVLAEDGKKMSKRLKNYPEPEIVMEKYGADAMRYYLITSPVMEAEALNFCEAGVREVYNKLVNTLSNVFEFYEMYAGEVATPLSRSAGKNKDSSSAIRRTKNDRKNVLDQWILVKLNLLIKDVAAGMESYELVKASRPIGEFVTELSQWYIRRSRDRFKGDDEKDKQAAVSTLREVLLTLSKVMAPFTPFIAEKVYLALDGGKESVHLEDWPKVNEKFTNQESLDMDVIINMETTRDIVECGLAARAGAGIKVKQPISELLYAGPFFGKKEYKQIFVDIIKDELNVKEVISLNSFGEMENVKNDPKYFVFESARDFVAINTIITPALKKEGVVREIVRAINQIRKEQKLTISDRIRVAYQTESVFLKEVLEEYDGEIKKGVLADDIRRSDLELGATEATVGGERIFVVVEK